MKPRTKTMLSLTASALLAAASFSALAEDTKAPMHMHKSEMDHRPDKEVASEYKTEAQQLREKAKSHRNLAQSYRTRTPPKGGASYANVAQHCDKLAKTYEEAAAEAEGVAAELTK